MKQNNRLEDFYDLFVNVKDFSGVTNENLSQALKQICEPERLDGDNKFFCDNCQSKEDALKGMNLGQLPKYVSVYVNRFEFDFVTMQRKKVKQEFQFPMEFDFGPYFLDGQGEVKHEYDLFGMIIHRGSPYAGHYYCIVKDIANEANRDKPSFFDINDTVVTPLEKNDFCQKYAGRKDDCAYILFYRKKGENEDIKEEYKIKVNEDDPIYKEIAKKNKEIKQSRDEYEALKNCIRVKVGLFKELLVNDYVDKDNCQVLKVEKEELDKLGSVKDIMIDKRDLESFVAGLKKDFNIELADYELYEVEVKWTGVLYFKQRVDIQNLLSDKTLFNMKYGREYYLVQKETVLANPVLSSFKPDDVSL